MKFDKYNTELINGSKGSIHIPKGSNLKEILESSDFINCTISDTYIRSSAIIKFELDK